MKAENYLLTDGVTFTAVEDTRFKTARLTLGIYLPLQERTAAVYAILPELLTHATAKAPDMIAMHRRQSALYGASLSAGVQRLGEQQVLTLSISCIEDRFALKGEAITAACAEFLCEILLKPHLSADGLFDAQDVAQEKRCLAERLAAQLNDKRLYARLGAERLLANGEPYGISVLGTEQSVEALTRESITDAYYEMLRSAQMRWVYIGSENHETVRQTVKAAVENLAERCPVNTITKTDFETVASPHTETMAMHVAQAKVSMGFRLQAVEPDARKVMAARLFSTLFGASPSSFLFRNVREKMSLCYYCSAAYERVKGVLMVDSGVNAADMPRAQEAILQQLHMIQQGDFTAEDLESARRYLKNALQESENSQGAFSAWVLGQGADAPIVTPAQAVTLLQTITAEEVAAVAQTVELHSVYAVVPQEESDV